MLPAGFGMFPVDFGKQESILLLVFSFYLFKTEIKELTQIPYGCIMVE
jgi:hypothetical protein